MRPSRPSSATPTGSDSPSTCCATARVRRPSSREPSNCGPVGPPPDRPSSPEFSAGRVGVVLGGQPYLRSAGRWGHLRDRLAGLPDEPARALPEIGVELPARLCHRQLL